MENLIDRQTRVVLVNLAQVTGDVSTIMRILAVESFGCPLPVWDVDEIRECAISSGVRSIVVLFHGAHLLSPAVLARILAISRSIFSAECTIVWLFDDLYGVLRLPLTQQMDLDIVHVKAREAADYVMEIVGELLAHKLLPTAEVIDRLLKLAAADRHAKSSIKRYVKARVHTREVFLPLAYPLGAYNDRVDSTKVPFHSFASKVFTMHNI